MLDRCNRSAHLNLHFLYIYRDYGTFCQWNEQLRVGGTTDAMLESMGSCCEGMTLLKGVIQHQEVADM